MEKARLHRSIRCSLHDTTRIGSVFVLSLLLSACCASKAKNADAPATAEVPAAASPDAVTSLSQAPVALLQPRGANARTVPGPESVCGGNQMQNVETYDGSRGVTKPFVKQHQKPVMQLQWNADFGPAFNAPNSSPGDVAGERWCTGTLIRDDLVLTAGHCFEVNPNGWHTPVLAGKNLQPAQLATLMHVNFNYQLDATTGQLHNADEYPITALVEFGQGRAGKLDYAIVRIGPNTQGGKASDKYPLAEMDTSEAARAGAKQLTLIQHPEGSPKLVDSGADIQPPRNVHLRYGDLDSLGGSSGSGIIDQNGKIIGVHTNGGCTSTGGYNYGVSLRAIRNVSDIVN
jgi:V8-like Glu-specific endopeptidase